MTRRLFRLLSLCALCLLVPAGCALPGLRKNAAGENTFGNGGFSGLYQSPFPDSAIDLIRAAFGERQASVSLYLEPGTETVRLGAGDLDPAGLVLDDANSPGEVVIDGGGRAIVLDGASVSLITVGTGVTLTLRNITLAGAGTSGAKRPLIRVGAGGHLILESGASITGNTVANSGAGGVAVESGRVTMKGGLISANSSIGAGGGVLVYPDGEFIMEGGAISGNEAVYGGGGAAVEGTFIMKGGTISGNAGYDGGGVLVSGRGGTFIMEGGVISGNSAGSGGGVSVFSGSGGAVFIMRGGTISGNSAGTCGGGVLVYSGCGFEKKPAAGGFMSGTIYGSDAEAARRNTAGESGHAVYFTIPAQYRNTTAGPGDNSIGAGFWERTPGAVLAGGLSAGGYGGCLFPYKRPDNLSGGKVSSLGLCVNIVGGQRIKAFQQQAVTGESARAGSGKVKGG
jgi:hypothetical protein